MWEIKEQNAMYVWLQWKQQWFLKTEMYGRVLYNVWCWYKLDLPTFPILISSLHLAYYFLFLFCALHNAAYNSTHKWWVKKGRKSPKNFKTIVVNIGMLLYLQNINTVLQFTAVMTQISVKPQITLSSFKLQYICCFDFVLIMPLYNR